MQAVTRTRWIYQLITLPFVITMIATGIMLLSGACPHPDDIRHLSYPDYLCLIPGTAQILAGAAILQNRFSFLKEWAYAGYSLNLISAAASHALSGGPAGTVAAPLMILLTVLVSYVLWKNALSLAGAPAKFRSGTGIA